MTREQLLSRISVDPNVCSGKPCVRGHRIWVSLILDLLAAGESNSQILANYPGLEEADILACIAYGSEMSRERYVDFPREKARVKFKLDENLGLAEARILKDAGFEVATVREQNLEGTSDRTLIAVCRDEGRCLVTLDAEFGNPLLYPPEEFRGIILLRLTSTAIREAITACMTTLRDALLTLGSPPSMTLRVASPDRSLWIVQPSRVRLYQPEGSLRARHPDLTLDEISLLRVVHAHSKDHRDAILSSKQCGCFYCLKLFAPSEVNQWSPDGQMALCPRCGIDSVLPNACGAELTENLLTQMNQFWFGRLP